MSEKDPTKIIPPGISRGPKLPEPRQKIRPLVRIGKAGPVGNTMVTADGNTYFFPSEPIQA